MQGTLSINVTVSLPVLLQLCRPLESVETPNPVREVWAIRSQRPLVTNTPESPFLMQHRVTLKIRLAIRIWVNFGVWAGVRTQAPSPPAMQLSPMTFLDQAGIYLCTARLAATLCLLICTLWQMPRSRKTQPARVVPALVKLPLALLGHPQASVLGSVSADRTAIRKGLQLHATCFAVHESTHKMGM